jgi:hypothetical protein
MAKKNNLKIYSGDEFFILINETLMKCDTIDLVILKGHVLIEYILNMSLLITSKVKENDFIDRMSFAQKLNLIINLIVEEPLESSLLEQVNLINNLRNDIAHRLIYNEQHLHELFKKYKGPGELFEKCESNNKSQLTVCLMFLLATLYVCLITTRITHKEAIKTVQKDIDNYIAKHLPSTILALKQTKV